MSDDLVERARLAIASEWGCASPCRSQPECTCARDARLAVNMALEEAAKVAEAFPARTHGSLASAPYAAAEQAGDEIAAAIRALIKESS